VACNVRLYGYERADRISIRYIRLSRSFVGNRIFTIIRNIHIYSNAKVLGGRDQSRKAQLRNRHSRSVYKYEYVVVSVVSGRW